MGGIAITRCVSGRIKKQAEARRKISRDSQRKEVRRAAHFRTEGNVALCSSGEETFNEKQKIFIECVFMPKQTYFHVFKKQLTLKDSTVSRYFPLFICGGPSHLSSFKQCSGNLSFALRTACLFSHGKQQFSPQ